MVDLAPALSLISSYYDAAISGRAWSHALQQTASLLGARAALMRRFWDVRDHDELRSPGDRLVEHYRRLDYARHNYRLASTHRHYDIVAARAHQILPIGVTYGYGSKEELLGAGAAALCDSPPQVAEFLSAL